MEETGPIRDARENFRNFTQNLPTDRHDEEYKYLQEWLAQWLERGDGIAMTGRSYETFLRVSIDIADAVLRRELRLDYAGTAEADYTDARPRDVDGIHQPGYTGAHFLDRAQYEITAYRWERGVLPK